ncbi:ATPase subunit of ABC transporter with duplicated ATPase domains [Fontibacillus solani]|uniref:ATPase subunit of ABC transporter with duplicated ATPase domains n=1 Tax=Fontibacillus solani TaxID=1572857 RepID=A0A7W3XPY0_9BACL|nr:ABC-F type ribosomal protection protein [Fontibacillus solani]MBA9084002.1 ATPase subunit of ABC transporter with duplicated ATPase domains [Fontibacillus solani]
MQIKAENIQKIIGGNILFEKFEIEVEEGEHVAIVGRNGCGKTTLLHMLAGMEDPDQGRIIKKKESTIGYLHQIPHYPGMSVEAVLLEAYSGLLEIKERMSELEKMMSTAVNDTEQTLKVYGELQETFFQQGGYEMDSQIANVSTGLGIQSLIDQPFASLSGGEQTKVMLGQILLKNPTILLLDEPTNHLDMNAIEWLEGYLGDFSGTVIAVSHDRQFLNNIAMKVIEIEDGEACTYVGNYDAYVQEKEAKMMREFAEYKEQQKKIKKMKETIKRLKQWANESNPPNASLHRRAKSMEKALAKIELVKKPITPKKLNLNLETSERSGKEVVIFEETGKSYEKPLFKDVNFSVHWQDKLAIVGENGTGKSTLLKIILGETKPDYGSCKIGSNVKMGYLSQKFVYDNDEARLIDVFRDSVAVAEGEARHILAQFLFYGYDVFKKVKGLSGGEKMRLRLAQLMYEEVNLLILDEPTNHLDIESREVLEDTLRAFEGTIIAVSHDRYFLQQIFTKIAWIEQQHVALYEGDYDWVATKRIQLVNKPRPIVQNKKQVSPQEPRTKEKVKIRDFEQEIALLEREIESIQSQNADETDWTKYEVQLQQQHELQKALDQCYEDWIQYQDDRKEREI